LRGGGRPPPETQAPIQDEGDHSEPYGAINTSAVSERAHRSAAAKIGQQVSTRPMRSGAARLVIRYETEGVELTRENPRAFRPISVTILAACSSAWRRRAARKTSTRVTTRLAVGGSEMCAVRPKGLQEINLRRSNTPLPGRIGPRGGGRLRKRPLGHRLPGSHGKAARRRRCRS
jgi:hypothetical protein